jgi:uncharacterized protein (DUF927 family)
LDDTKIAGTGKNKEGSSSMIAKTIYQICSGQGRTRGSMDGLRETESFSTICLSTGESPIISLTQDGGLRGRVIELWVSPFKEVTKETSQLIDEINRIIAVHYGHAGPRVVEYILNHVYLQTFLDRCCYNEFAL